MSSSAADSPGQVTAGPPRAWTLPGYTELRALGGGGFGEVVLAAHDGTGTQVAIKYLHPDLLRDADQAAGFRAEARTLAGLDSPHVVRLYEYVETPAGAAIVMELVDGVTLAKLLEQQGKTTPEAALVVLFGSLLGLAAAHAEGVVHRDYKPANVLVNGQGTSKLTDFGIAALAGGRPVPAGTLRYMPPEQFEGVPASPAADVYAATVTFYQCLTGRVPFDGRTATELYDLHKSADVPMDPVPERLRPVIARGMAKDPKFRPSDAAGLAAELRDAAAFGYGDDWEDRGRSHLAEAALLLALLWPSGSAPATQGATVAHTPLTEPPAHPAPPAGQAGPATGHNGQAGHAQAEHIDHVKHVQHLEHVEHLEHVQHLDHVEHEEHLEHLEHASHEEHLAHVTRGEASDKQPARPRKRPRPRVRHVAFAAAAVAAAVVIGVVAAFATSGHSSPPPSGAPSPGVSTAAAGAPTAAAAPAGAPSPAGSSAAAAPVFDVSFTMARHVNTCSSGETGGCPQEPLPLTLVCQAGGSCTASSSHWGATHQLTVNGNSMSFTGSDPGVIGACDGVTTVSTITMDITVLSWTVSGATRAPKQLTAQYTVSAPPTGGCGQWYWEATLTS